MGHSQFKNATTILVSTLCTVAIVRVSNAATPLADAAQRSDRSAVRTLIQQKTDLNEAQGDGMTALHWAASNGDAEIAQLLVGAHANLEATTRLDAMTPLFLAAKSGSAAVVDILLKAGANARTASQTGTTALMVAAESGSAKTVELLIAHGVDVNARESVWGQTPLIFAAAADRAEVIHVLMQHGAKAELASQTKDPGCGSVFDRDACGPQEDDNGQAPRNTPHQEKLHELVEPKPVAEAKSKPDKPKPPAEEKGDAPVLSPEEAATKAEIGALRGELKKLESMIDALDEKTAGPSGRRRRRGATIMGGMTALLFAAREGNLDAARALLTEGANVNNVGEGEKLSPLVMAIVNGHFDVARFLLENNADPNLANLEGLAPLYATIDMRWAPYAWRPQPIASQEHTSYLDLMRLLLEHGANPNARLTHKVWFRALPGDNTWVDQAGATAFWRAALATDVDAMRLLVNAGANPKLPTYEGVTPLMVAAGLGWTPNFTRNASGEWTEAVKYCLELGLDVNARSMKGYTALHGSAFRGDNDLIQFLVSKGADVKAVAKDKNTIADMANGPFPHSLLHPETVALLEKLGAKNSNNCRADTCLVAPKPKKEEAAAKADKAAEAKPK